MLSLVRLSIRRWRRAPVAAFAAISTLALGIGGNIAVISVIRGALVDRLPYPQASRIVEISKMAPPSRRQSLSGSEFSAVVTRASALRMVVACAFRYSPVRGGNSTVLADVGRVSPAFFDLFGTPAVRGRVLTPADFRAGTAAVVISSSLSDSLFGPGIDASGRELSIAGLSFVVVGVMPPSFLPRCAGEQKGGAAWLPLTTTAPKGIGPAQPLLAVFGRLGLGVTLADTQTQLDSIFRQGTAERSTQRIVAEHLGAAESAAVAPGLLILRDAGGAVLLMTCLNMTVLMLVVGVRWRDELLVRWMLGARRSVLVRQLTIHAVSSATTGAFVGFLLAAWGVPVLVRIAGPLLPPGTTTHMRWPDFVVGVSLGVATAVVSGIGPAFFASGQIIATVKGPAVTRSVGRVYGVLIMVQTAVAVTVVIGAALLVHSFVQVIEPPLGFDPSGLTVAADIMAPSGFDTRAEYVSFEKHLENGVRTAFAGLPLAIGDWVPSGLSATTEWTLLNPDGTERRVDLSSRVRTVSRDFFEVLRIPIVAGTGFSHAEMDAGSSVAVVTEEFAQRFARDVNVIGFRLRGPGSKVYRIIGVVANSRGDPFRVEFLDAVYLPMDQSIATRWSIAVRSNNPTETARRLSATLASVSPDSSVDHIVEDVGAAVRQPEGERYFYVLVLALFAGVVTIEACVGVFAAVGHMVALRNREWAVRAALGAPRYVIAGAAVRGALVPAFVGLVAGLAVVWIAAGELGPDSFIGSQLYRVAARDPLSFIVGPIGLLVICAAACAIPARRAVKTDPAQILKAE